MLSRLAILDLSPMVTPSVNPYHLGRGAVERRLLTAKENVAAAR